MIKAIVIDDSLLMRTKIKEMLEREGDIKVVATAANGIQGLEEIKKHSPDVVTLDVQMPKMDGLATLKRIMQDCPTRVIMFTGHTTYGGEETVKALEFGAIDFVLKPSGSLSLDIETVEVQLREKVRGAMQANVARIAESSPQLATAEHTDIKDIRKIILVGASMGGPRAIGMLLDTLPVIPGAAVIIIQHMPAMFTTSFSMHLNTQYPWHVAECSNGDVITPGGIYVAPGGKHLGFEIKDGQCLASLVEASFVKSPYVPSISYTMSRAAELFGDKSIGVILTGMGNDGVDGLKKIRAAGGHTITESEESAIVFGMPKQAAEQDAAEFVMHLKDISKKIVELSKGK